MNLVIKNLYVVAAMSLLVAVAGIASAATWEENFDLPGCAYTASALESQCGWITGLDGNGPPSGWEYDAAGGRDGSGGAVSTDSTWAHITQPHGLDTSLGRVFSWSYDVLYNGDFGQSSAFDAGLRGGNGWMLFSLRTWDSFIFHSGGWGQPRANEIEGTIGEIPNGWYTLGVDWTVGGDAIGSIRDAFGIELVSVTMDTSLLTNPMGATHVNIDNGWTGSAVDNIVFTDTGPISPFDPILPIDFTWNTTQSGDWNVGSNWTSVAGPPGNPATENRANHSATFGDVIQSNRTVFVDDDVSVRAIVFDNTNTYVVAGPGSVNLVQGTAEGPPPTAITVNQGSHQFQAAVNMMNNTSVDVASGATLLFNNVLNLMSHTLTKSGDGVLEVNNRLTTAGGSLNVLQGTVAGVGTIGGNVNNNGGAISPGAGSLSGKITPVPEPASWLLLVGGLGVIGFVRCSQPHGAFARLAK